MLPRLLTVSLWPRSIRAKLVRILVVSLTLVLVLLGFLIAGEATNYRSANQTSRIVTVVLRVQDVVQQLQRERALTNGVLGGATQFQARLAPQRQQTDGALGALDNVIDDSDYSGAGAGQVAISLGKLAGLTRVRSDVDQRRAQAASTFAFYTDAIGALNGLDLGLDQARDGPLRHGLQALYALADAKESAGQERGLLTAVFASNRMSVDNYTKFVQVLGQKAAAITAFDRFATPAQRAELAGVLQLPADDQAMRDERVASNSATGRLPSRVDAVSWSDAMSTVLDRLRGVQQNVGVDTTDRAESLRHTATALLVAISVLAVLIVAGMIALVVGAARSVIGPLGTLARDADQVATRHLPETVALMQTTETEVPPPPPVTVPATAASEIQLVARALDRVQETALMLASEQALIRRNTTASLANLGRRNQNLVRRQLSLISEFEREELDPGALANMFELDHLATRMRRNAESLLVLVGETSPRPWSAPLPVADVIRAALSEVEDYRRVVLRRVDDAWVAGAVVAEVAHMLAELMENGLSFSSPDVEVEVYGRKIGNRYLLAVVDYGIGMPSDELDRARARLRDEENFLVAPTRFLGHYVVGRLAGRLGVQVELGESPVSGITARLLLPVELLADAPEPAVTSVRSEGRPAAGRGGPQPVVPAVATRADRSSGEPSPPAIRPAPAGSGSPASTGRFEVPVATSSGELGHRWPTEQELASGAAAPNGTVSVATLAESVPRQPKEAGSAGPERTRNGLVKRQPRHRDGTASRPPVAPPPSRHPVVDDAPKDRSPSDVGSMLAAFRSGHQRGELTGRTVGPETGQSPVAREEEPGDH